MKKRSFALLSALSIAAMTSMSFAEADKSAFKPAPNVSFDDIIPGVVAFGTVSGNRETGPHGTFVRILPGQATPPHTHSAAYSAVVVQGILENPITGDSASDVPLPAGSFHSVPANAPHVTRCAASSPVECITYFYQDVPFDFSLVKE